MALHLSNWIFWLPPFDRNALKLAPYSPEFSSTTSPPLLSNVDEPSLLKFSTMAVKIWAPSRLENVDNCKFRVKFSWNSRLFFSRVGVKIWTVTIENPRGKLTTLERSICKLICENPSRERINLSAFQKINDQKI